MIGITRLKHAVKVTLVQPQMGDLAAKNREFVSEHHDLELLELARAQPQRRHRKHTPKQQVQQRRDQSRLPPPESEEADSPAATQLRAAREDRMDLRTRQAARLRLACEEVLTVSPAGLVTKILLLGLAQILVAVAALAERDLGCGRSFPPRTSAEAPA